MFICPKCGGDMDGICLLCNPPITYYKCRKWSSKDILPKDLWPDKMDTKNA